MANTVKYGITAEDQGFQQTMNAAAKAAGNLNSALTIAGKQYNTVNGALRAAKKEATELTAKWRALDDEVRSSDFGKALQSQLQEVLNTAGELQDIKGDVANEVKNIASDTKMWDGAAQGIGILSSSVQGLSAAYGLLGGDVTAFTRALTIMNGVQAVTNTIIGIGNALQKDSALMVALRAAKTALLTTATNAQTAAQLKLNLAMLANPYVLTAAAVIGLTAAIVSLVSSLNDATTAERQAKMIGDEFNNQMDSQSSTVGKQIQTFTELQEEYNACCGSTAKLNKFIQENQKKFDELQISVTDADKAHKIFGGNSKAYVNAAISRASALASEAMEAALLGKTVSELSKVYAAFARGEEVNWADLKDIVQSVTGWGDLKATAEMKAAGFSEKDDGIFGKNDAYAKNATEAMVKLINAAVTDQIYVLQDATKQLENELTKNLTDTEKEINKEMSEYGKKTKSTGKKSGASKKSGSGKSELALTQKEVESLSKSWDGLNQVIDAANKKINNLRTDSKTYAADVKNLKALILTAEKAKFNIIDQSTAAGLSLAKQQIQQIISILPEGSAELEEWKKKEDELTKKIAERAMQYINTNTFGNMQKAKSEIMDLINAMDIHDPQVAELARRWYEVNKAEEEAKRTLDGMLNGVQEGSKAWLKQQISDIDAELDKLGPNNNVNLKTTLQIKRDRFQYDLNKLEKESSVEIVGKLKLNELDRSYKMTALEEMEAQFDRLKKKQDDLRASLETATSETEANKITNEISALNEELTQLKKNMNMEEISNDVKQYSRDMFDAVMTGAQSTSGALSSLYDAFAKLPDRLDECENGFEGFLEVMNTLISVVGGIMSVVDAIDQIINITNMLTAAKTVQNGILGQETATYTEQTAALGAETGAQVAKTAADGASVAPALLAAAAAKTQAKALEEQAAAAMFAAHAYIPFAGAAIGAAQVGIMMATITGLKSLEAFANGGIVKGSTTVGDRVLARLNAGEAVINKTQQSRLLNIIDHGIVNNDNNSMQISTVKVSGADLYLALKNFGKINKKKTF